MIETPLGFLKPEDTDNADFIRFVADNMGLIDGEIQKREISIVKSSTAPASPTANLLWVDTSVTPNVLKRYDSVNLSWVKLTPTTADEVGAYSKSETDTKLNSKSDTSHNHDGTYVKGNLKMTVGSSTPTSPNGNDLWIDLNE